MPNLSKHFKKREDPTLTSMDEVEKHAKELITASLELKNLEIKMRVAASMLSGEDASRWSKDKLMQYVQQVKTLLKVR